MIMNEQTRFFTTQKYKIAGNVATGVINENDFVITTDTHELYFVDSQKNIIPITTTKELIGLENVTNTRQINGRASGTVPNHVVVWGANGYTVEDSGFTIASNVPANAKFTDTTYGLATIYGSGLMSGFDKEKLNGIEEGAKANVRSDWNATTGDAVILNKPTIPTDNAELTNGAGYITQEQASALITEIIENMNGDNLEYGS